MIKSKITPRLLYRIAACLLVAFAVGHTNGILAPKNLVPEAMQIRDAMFAVHFQFMGADCTWGGFYLGFGLFVTLYMLLTAVLAWQLGDWAQSRAQEIRFLAWTFFAVQAATVVLCWNYFFLPPTIFSALISVCLGVAAWLVSVVPAADNRRG